jgi:hypothetical protein
MRLLYSTYLGHNLRTAERIFVKFDAWELHWNLSTRSSWVPVGAKLFRTSLQESGAYFGQKQNACASNVAFYMRLLTFICKLFRSLPFVMFIFATAALCSEKLHIELMFVPVCLVFLHEPWTKPPKLVMFAIWRSFLKKVSFSVIILMNNDH